MRKFAALLTAVGLSATSALAATVSFAPSPLGSETVNVADLPTDVKFDLVVGGINQIVGPLGGVSSLDIVVGSEGPLTINGFLYSPTWTAGALLPPPVPGPFGSYPSDLYFGGAQQLATRPGGPLFNLGTLTVGVPAGTAPGSYFFKVDNAVDQFSFLNGDDALNGIGTIQVVPEPATLGLLALGALGLIRRRLA